MRNEITVGVIIADVMEFATLTETMEKYNPTPCLFYGRQAETYVVKNEERTVNCIAVLSGIGKVNASTYTALLAPKVDILLNFGYCGGIGALNHLSIFVPTSFIEHDFDMTVFGRSRGEKPNDDYEVHPDRHLVSMVKKILKVHEGKIATGDSFICDKETADYLRNELGVSGCDMEAAGVAYAAKAVGVPFCSIKKVSDSSDDESAVEEYEDVNYSGDEGMAHIVRSLLIALLDEDRYFTEKVNG